MDALELNVWTSSLVSNAHQDPKTNIWSVSVTREGGSTRTLRVKHLVFAIGFGDCLPTMPEYPGAVSSFNIAMSLSVSILRIGPV